MNILVKFVTLLLIAVLTNTAQAGTQTVNTLRAETYQLISPYIRNNDPIRLTSDGSTATYKVSSELLNSSNGTSFRIVLAATNGVGVTQRFEPHCDPTGVIDYTDSTGHYVVTCNVLVQYANEPNYTHYDPSKITIPIAKLAFDTSWTKNGVSIDPSETVVPGNLAYAGRMNVYSDRGYITCYYTFITLDTSYNTALSLNIDDVASVTGDDAIINYSWNVSPGTPFVSAMNTKMSMQQLDSNIVMSYVKPDGSGSAVIVPNHYVVLEDTSKRLTSNGQIKLKLASKTGFGTKSSRLRVTVEWQ